MPARIVRAPLLRRDSMGPLYHVLTFDVPRPLDAASGQFLMVRGATWGSAPLLPRPMSCLTSGDRPSILVKVVGEGTRRMAHASPGEPFDLHGPLGRGWAPCPPDRTPVFVAGGVGVAPLLFLAREMHAAGRRGLGLYGGRGAADLPLHGELGAVAELRVATEDGSRGTRGLVTALLEVALGEAVGRRAKVYACGPHRMMAAAAALCARAGVPCEVSLETPMACGYGVCLGCPAPRARGGYLYACTEGPCVDASELRWEDDP